jgi:uncharacterized protein YjbI with pentapeptide repeats
MTGPPYFKPPPARVLELLYNHQRWLQTKGRFGKRLVGVLRCEACDFDGVDFSRARIESGSYFLSCSFKGARFARTRFVGTQFDWCDFTDTDFKSACVSMSQVRNSKNDDAVDNRGKGDLTFFVNNDDAPLRPDDVYDPVIFPGLERLTM